MQLDHVVPKALNGPDDAFNRQWVCGTCNSHKADRLAFLHWQPPNPDPGAKKYCSELYAALGVEHAPRPKSGGKRAQLEECEECGTLLTLTAKKTSVHCERCSEAHRMLDIAK